MMRREGGRVVIDISADEFDLLLMALGVATSRDAISPGWQRNMLLLINSINEGNPHFTRYAVPPSTETTLDG